MMHGQQNVKNQHDHFHHHQSYLQLGFCLLFYLKSTETYYSKDNLFLKLILSCM
jgi:hypothetical protein